PLCWDGGQLSLGEPRPESAILSVDGLGFVEPLQAGDWVSLHWEWVCDRLDQRQLANLQRFSNRQLEMTNRDLAHAGHALILG
ncbi:MAG: DUF6390 family protein, partial [Actinomycetota bacterium]|nr:DUF6390 family protein [Actinomycetota bacterium]